MKISTSILASILLASATGMFIPATPELEARGLSEEAVVPRRYIVVMKPGLSQQEFNTHKEQINEKQKVVKGAQLKAFSRNSGIIGEFDLQGKVRGYTGYFAPETLEYLKNLEVVKLIEKDENSKSHKMTNDRLAPWGLTRISQRDTINHFNYKGYTYDDEGGTNVTAYIIDSGINTNHVEFEGRATWGATFSDFGDYDGLGHGTHVAGIVGGKHYGVAKNVNLVSVKVIGDDHQGSKFNIIKGIEWAIQDAESRKGKPGFKGAVANMSLGMDKSEALNMVVNTAAESLILSVSAGNGRYEACDFSPASAEGVITVGASNGDDDVAEFSNVGECVDIFAPGERIISAAFQDNYSEEFMSGTSMAAPHVTGLAAYFLSLQPESGSAFSGSTITTAQMKKALIAFGTKGVLDGAFWGTPNVLVYNGAEGDFLEFYAEL